jgi:hypothetical protein
MFDKDDACDRTERPVQCEIMHGPATSSPSRPAQRSSDWEEDCEKE